MTGSKPPPKGFLHILRSSVSSFKWEYPLLSLSSPSSFLRLLHRLLFTSISPFIFPSISCFRRQFRRKMWPIQLAFRLLIQNYLYMSVNMDGFTSRSPSIGINLSAEGGVGVNVSGRWYLKERLTKVSPAVHIWSHWTSQVCGAGSNHHE